MYIKQEYLSSYWRIGHKLESLREWFKYLKMWWDDRPWSGK